MKALIFVELNDVWSYLAAVRFERAAAVFTIITGEPVDIGYRAHRLPGLPDAGEAVGAARISGIDLNVDEIIEADPRDAWRLLTWAIEFGDAAQRDLIHQLWRAQFLEGADIADHFVLASRAALIGLDLEQADALLASTEYDEQVALQLETAEDLSPGVAPFVVSEAGRVVTGIHSQDDYLKAIYSLADDYS